MRSKPNTDIGINADDDAYFRRQYPDISDFVIWPALRDAFTEHEDEAKALKTGSRRNSFLAITLIVLSLTLFLLNNSGFFTDVTPNAVLITLRVVAVILLILAIFCGKGILFGRKRDQWLTHRVIAERIRQFHFQYLLSHAASICSGGAVQRNAVLRERDRALEKMLRRVDAPDYKQKVRDDGSLEEARLIPLDEADLRDDGSPRARQLKDFWTEMRFEWQSGYATGQLDRKSSSFLLFGSLADQKAALGTLEYTATLGIVVLQVAVAVIQFLTPPDWALQLPVLVISLLAVAIVGLKAYEDGVNLSEDVSRNRTYAAYASKLLRDFKDARAKHDGQAEFRAMREMEDVAYFELQQFLHVHSAARFSL